MPAANFSASLLLVSVAASTISCLWATDETPFEERVCFSQEGYSYERCCARGPNPTWLDGDLSCWNSEFNYCQCCLLKKSSDKPIVQMSDVVAVMGLLQQLYASIGMKVVIRADGKAIVLDNLQTGGGLGPFDINLMLELSSRTTPSRIFIVGNAFGLSTLTAAIIFPEAAIDVIDAEMEGAGNAAGSEITRRLASENGLNIKLTVGFSPRDTPSALRGGLGGYGFAFIDGKHKNRQLLEDVLGIYPFLAPRAVLMLHDVGFAHLHRGVARVIRARKEMQYHYLEHAGLSFPNIVGTGLLVPARLLHEFCDLAKEPIRSRYARSLVNLSWGHDW